MILETSLGPSTRQSNFYLVNVKTATLSYWCLTNSAKTQVKTASELTECMKMKSGFDLVFPVLSSYVMRDNFHKVRFQDLWCFLLSFSTGCIKWNTAAINSLLLFMAGLFIEFLVEKCAACQSWKSDFGWHRFRLSPCWMPVEKSLKRFWPYLIAFKSCISNGKPE